MGHQLQLATQAVLELDLAALMLKLVSMQVEAADKL